MVLGKVAFFDFWLLQGPIYEPQFSSISRSFKQPLPIYDDNNEPPLFSVFSDDSYEDGVIIT